jgi:predicted neuraminidase
MVMALAVNGAPALVPGRIEPRFATPAPASASGTVSFHEETIDPHSPYPMSHVASICELPDGRLLAAWYAGSREGASDVAIFLSERTPAGSAWSPPRAIVTRESAARELKRTVRKIGNPVIFADAAGTVWLVYVTVSLGGWSGSSLNLTTSTDGGATWARSRRLTLSPFLNIAELVKNRPVPLADGGWAVPIYHELAARFSEILWLRRIDGGVRATKTRVTRGQAGFQPALVALDDRRALAVMRDVGSTRRIWTARTDDAGDGWAASEPLDLPNPDSGLDAIRIGDGRLLLAFNDSTSGRENLRLAISRDDGRTWTRVATLAEESGGDFSYPFLLQSRSGDVHVVYSWKRRQIRHVVFNPAWLDEREREAAR